MTWIQKPKTTCLTSTAGSTTNLPRHFQTRAIGRNPACADLVSALLTAPSISRCRLRERHPGPGAEKCRLSGTRYLGTDVSEGLLSAAREALGQPEQGEYTFQQSDLSYPDWAQQLPQQTYQALVSFAVLHHLPGKDLRLRTGQAFRKLIDPQGFAAISVWQWQNSPRLAKRVLPWSEAGLTTEAVDEGDVLLDWRAK